MDYVVYVRIRKQRISERHIEIRWYFVHSSGCAFCVHIRRGENATSERVCFCEQAENGTT